METAFSALGDDDSLRTRGRETGYPCQGFSSCHPSPASSRGGSSLRVKWRKLKAPYQALSTVFSMISEHASLKSFQLVISVIFISLNRSFLFEINTIFFIHSRNSNKIH